MTRRGAWEPITAGVALLVLGGVVAWYALAELAPTAASELAKAVDALDALDALHATRAGGGGGGGSADLSMPCLLRRLRPAPPGWPG